jgi:hypothetical protein
MFIGDVGDYKVKLADGREGDYKRGESGGTEQDGETAEQTDEAHEHKGDEGIEGEPLPAGDALPEEAAVVVLVLHAGLALDAVTHISVHLPLAPRAEVVAVAHQLHVRLGLDARVQQYCQQVGGVEQQQHEDVDVLGGVVELLVVAVAAARPLQDNDEEEERVDEEDAGEGGEGAFTEDEEGGGAFAGVAQRPVSLQGVVEALLGGRLR